MTCGVFSNYSPQKIARNGMKFRPLTITINGIFYQNGQKYLGTYDGQAAPGPASSQAPAVNIPRCGCS